MKPETAERLTNALEKAALKVSDQPTFEEAVNEVSGALFVVLKHLRRARSKERVYAALLDGDEPTPAQIKMMEGFLYFAPRIFSGWSVGPAQGVIKRAQKGGRREIFAEHEQRDICDAIRLLVEEKGRTYVEAKREIARKRGVNEKTIHRIWERRTELPPSGIDHKQVESFLETLGKSE